MTQMVRTRTAEHETDWVLIRSARSDAAQYAKDNRAAIDAEWDALWDGRIEPLNAAMKRQADAEWNAL